MPRRSFFLIYIYLTFTSQSRLQELAHRQGFNPKVFYTDTFPHLKETLEGIFMCMGRLGIFHYLKRVTKTMDLSHPQYHEARVELSECVFEYDAGDIQLVKRVLEADTMSAKVFDILYIQPFVSALIHLFWAETIQWFRQGGHRKEDPAMV
jgi:hypothetical protein